MRTAPAQSGMIAVVLAVLRYVDPHPLPDPAAGPLLPLLTEALGVLSAADGCEAGWVGRSPDDLAVWLLVTVWRDAGALRRGLGGYAAKVALGPLQQFSDAGDVVVEVLASSRSGDTRGTDRAADADATGPLG